MGTVRWIARQLFVLLGVRRMVAWLEDRLGLRRFEDMVYHSVPPAITEPHRGWLYALGSATLAAFLLQVVTGIALATLYVPAPAHAYDSVRYITEQVWLGSLLRGMHYFGASAMVLLVGLHMVRVFLTGSYKFPRELNWISGVVLLFLTLVMAFTGQLLRWDANGVWGVFVASHYVGRVPLVGEALKQLVLAGDTIGGATLTRFYALHVVILPMLVMGFVVVHLYLVLHHGISEPPRPGRPVDPKSYRSWYQNLLRRSRRRYFPDAVWREAAAAVVVVVAVAGLALWLGPKAPGELPDPTQVPAEPKPDWFLLWYYGLIAIKPGRLETFVMVGLPLLAFVLLLVMPLVFSRGERSLRRRPWAVLVTAALAIALAVLTHLGHRAPWVMELATSPPSAAELAGLGEPARRGAVLFEARGCQHCHAVGGRGGDYGPPLAGITKRLPDEVITARIVQGYGDMPAYRSVLERDELEAILAYLHALEEQR